MILYDILRTRLKFITYYNLNDIKQIKIWERIGLVHSYQYTL